MGNVDVPEGRRRGRRREGDGNGWEEKRERREGGRWRECSCLEGASWRFLSGRGGRGPHSLYQVADLYFASSSMVVCIGCGGRERFEREEGGFCEAPKWPGRVPGAPVSADIDTIFPCGSNGEKWNRLGELAWKNASPFPPSPPKTGHPADSFRVMSNKR